MAILRYILIILALGLPSLCLVVRLTLVHGFIASNLYAQYSWKIIFLVLGIELLIGAILVRAGKIKIDPLLSDGRELKKVLRDRVATFVGLFLFAVCYPGIVIPILTYPFLEEGFSVNTKIKEIRSGGGKVCLNGKVVLTEYHSGFLSSFSQGLCFDRDFDTRYKVGDSVLLTGVGDEKLGIFVNSISKT